jgi:hypothetical protein
LSRVYFADVAARKTEDVLIALARFGIRLGAHDLDAVDLDLCVAVVQQG